MQASVADSVPSPAATRLDYHESDVALDTDRVLYRSLLVLLCGALLIGCASYAAGLEKPATQPLPHRVGFLGAAGEAPWHRAFRESMQALGYAEGRDLIIETRYAQQRPGALDQLAAELVGIPVDVIVVADFEAAGAVLTHTNTVPVVLANSGTPLPESLVASHAQGHSNLTGIGASAPELGAKRLEIARAAFPSLRQLGILRDPKSNPRRSDWNALVSASSELGLELHDLPYQTPGDFEPALVAARQANDELVLVMGSQSIARGHEVLLDIAITQGVPLMFERPELVEYGALIAYGPSLRESYARSAVYVDRILRGAVPWELPFEEPPAAQLGINLRTAQAQGISISLPVVLQAERIVS
jgi:putative tryptophan/tyrosine transport system substrate-binding protein